MLIQPCLCSDQMHSDDGHDDGQRVGQRIAQGMPPDRFLLTLDVALEQDHERGESGHEVIQQRHLKGNERIRDIEDEDDQGDQDRIDGLQIIHGSRPRHIVRIQPAFLDHLCQRAELAVDDDEL